MIAYEIQLRYVISDKIQSETNSVQDKIQSEKKSSLRKNRAKILFSWKKIFVKKYFSQTLSRISSVQSELSWTNQCLS